MRALLVGPDLEENLSLRFLVASLRKAGHEAQIATFDTAQDAEAVLASARAADLVGLSMCYQIRAPEFLALARALKQARPGRLVIAGGHFASCAARELLSQHPELDLIVVHEGERTIVDLACLPRLSPEALATIPGIVYRSGDAVVATPPREAQADLDSLPWADRSGPPRLMEGVPTAYMMGSRGCLSACDYCCISTLHRMVAGKRFRQRSPENIVDEMAWLYHERGVRQFIFHDDNFLVPQVERNLERIEALDQGMRRKRLRRVGLALKCRPADVNRQVFLRLREMGLLRVFLGIESGSKAGLASIGRRQTVEQEHRALAICENLGISTQYTIILFHPEATLATMREDLAFVRQHAGHPLSFCRAEIYAGTPLERRMLDQARACGNYLARTYEYTDPVATLVWTIARELLRDRCWNQQNLLGRIIRLDHQATVLQHFYEGRAIDTLAGEFADFELAANLDTVALLEDLLTACEAHPSQDSAELRRHLDELAERERSQHARFDAQACAFAEAMRAQAAGIIDLARSQAAMGGGLLDRLPRHAAAVVLAMGLMNCNCTSQHGVSEMPPSPMDASQDLARDASADLGSPDGSVPDAASADLPIPDGSVREAAVAPDGSAPEAAVSPDARLFIDQGGMIEAPPPPMMDAPRVTPPDAQPDAGARDVGSSVDSGTGTDADASEAGASDARDATAIPDTRPDARVFIDQGGMIEAPPPPMDAPTLNKG
jgi:radical SAM superfamily enzyme YgiQ (UPF0313 family)